MHLRQLTLWKYHWLPAGDNIATQLTLLRNQLRVIVLAGNLLYASSLRRKTTMPFGWNRRRLTPHHLFMQYMYSESVSSIATQFHRIKRFHCYTKRGVCGARALNILYQSPHGQKNDKCFTYTCRSWRLLCLSSTDRILAIGIAPITIYTSGHPIKYIVLLS